MSAHRKNNQINLIPVDKFAYSTFGRILTWLMKTFRVLVMVVELVVVVAFLSRFWLDAKNSDLTDEIKAKVSQIQADATFEKEFADTQKKLQIFADLTAGSQNTKEIIKKISSRIPMDIVLSKIAISDNKVSLTGTSPLERSIAQYLVNIEALTEFDKTYLSQIKLDKETGDLIEFTLVAEIANIN